MSKERGKHRPTRKSAIHIREQLRRRTGTIMLAKRFLIVCEDDKSAPNYFLSLKKCYQLSASSIEILGSGGYSQPIQVIRKAIEIRDSAASASSATEPFEQVWCIIDGDYGAKVAVAREAAESAGVMMAVSNKCFEYWILLHYEENDKATLDCDRLVSKLKKHHLKEYEKGKCNFDSTVLKVHDARPRARKLRKPGIDRGDLPEVQNPCSEVYQLVDEIFGAVPADKSS